MERPTLLYLGGSCANLKNLDGSLNKELKITVVGLALPACIEAPSLKNENEDLNKIMNALGAALTDTQSINLLPQEVKAEKTKHTQKTYLKLASATAGVIFLLLLFMTGFQIRDYNNKIKEARLKLQAMSEISTLQQKIHLRENLIEKIQQKRTPTDGILKMISVLTPQEIILDELSLDQSNHALTLKGIVSASEDVSGPVLTNFMGQLGKSAYFTETTLVSSQQVGAVQRFEIKCNLAYE